MSVSRKGEKKNNRKAKGTKAVNTLLERWTWGIFNYADPFCLHILFSPVAQKPPGRQFQMAKYAPEGVMDTHKLQDRADRDQSWEGLEEGLQLFL